MELQSGIAEFTPVLQTELKYSFIAIAMSGVLAAWLVPQRRIVYALLYIIFGWLTYRYVRNLGLFALVMYVPVARLAQHLSQIYLGKAWVKLAPLALPVQLIGVTMQEQGVSRIVAVDMDAAVTLAPAA